jgi:preprotein translocase SecF subunit
MALVRRIPTQPNFNLVGKRHIFLVLSSLVVLGSILSVLVQGLNFGVDFRGGILMEIRTAGPANIAELRDELNDLGLGDVTLQEFGQPTDVLINVQEQEGGEQAQMQAIERIKAALGDRVEQYRRTEFVGPKVGAELKQAGLIATLLALGGIALYIWFRFEWHFALAALLALMHDVIGTVGFFSVTQIEFNLASVAAVLTVAGYSINDTVVVFDRVRENLRKYKRAPLVEVLNRSVNGTLTRTVLTSATTLLALVALSAFGGEVILGFTLALIWGLVIGTYSSVGLAVPLLIYMKVRRESLVLEEEGENQSGTSKEGAGS